MKSLIGLLIILLSGSVSYAAARSDVVRVQKRDAAKVFAPKTTAGDKRKFPLVLLLHGYSSNQDTMVSYFGYRDQVEARKFILVAPNGLRDKRGYRYWNATPACCDIDHAGNDDVSYLKNLIANAVARYPVDLRRVYVVGHSNGGFMAHRLGCEISDLVTGIISFAGQGQLNAADCNPSHPVSVLQIHALDDSVIKYAGDKTGFAGLAGYPSVEKTVVDWMQRNRCPLMQTSSFKKDLISTIPGADTTVDLSPPCASGSAVELWTIDRHQTVGHSPHSPRLRKDFTQATLDFVFAHSR